MTSPRRHRLLPLALALPALLGACAGTPESAPAGQSGTTADEHVSDDDHGHDHSEDGHGHDGDDHDHADGHDHTEDDHDGDGHRPDGRDRPDGDDHADHDHERGDDPHDGHEHDSPAAEEAPAPQPRLAAAYDGGVLVIDAQTFEVLLDAPLPGVVDLEPAGDGRHVLVTVTGDPGVRVLDTGAWSSAHGDHAHHFVTTPSLTDPAALPDGVVPGEVGRVPDGAVVTLGTDGALHVLDPVTGDITSAPVLDAWELPAASAATPALALLGETAYVSDPATGSIHAVDVVTGAVFASGTVPHAVRALAAAPG